jgi:hypothetical protein
MYNKIGKLDASFPVVVARQTYTADIEPRSLVEIWLYTISAALFSGEC